MWGRGAVDMKDMDAMTLAVVRDRLRSGRKPPRDIVLAFLADEEAGGTYGARYLVDNHPDLFEGVTEAIGEVGGFSFTVNEELRLYLIETAEKGMHWMRLTVDGTAGHGSMTNKDNAITELSEAVARLGRHEFPVRVTKTVRGLPRRAVRRARHRARPRGHGGDARQARRHRQDDRRHAAQHRQPRRCSAPATRSTSSPARPPPTSTAASCPATRRSSSPTSTGSSARASSARRCTPTRRWRPTSTARWSTRCRPRCIAEDPIARAVPYMLSGGTDAKSFDDLGIRCFGFAPLQLPPELDFAGMFHGVDERVPVDGLQFGVRVLDRFIDAC